MEYVRVRSYAKINLSLDITGVQGGYHMLDSVVTTVDLCDTVMLKRRRRDRLVTVSMHGLGSESIPYEKNNAAVAAERFIAAYGTDGADIAVHKNIPMGAGLGGSSADVAGVLNGMARLFGVDDADGIKRIADGIGSDCGYMLTGGYARITGRGENVLPIDSDLELDLLLLVPGTPVSTPDCYRAYDAIRCRRPHTSEEVVRAVADGDRVALGKALGNGLLPAAYSLNPEVGEAVKALQALGPLGVTMTGSGSCVYALFENDQFARYALSRYRGKCRAFTAKTHL